MTVEVTDTFSLWYLLSDDISSLCGVLALADDITDLLVTEQEIDAIGGQSQEGVVGVMDLQRRTERSGSTTSSWMTEGQRSDEAAAGLTVTRFVSGSAMTPLLFRWKSPMLRVMASRPLTLAWPTLFHVTKPPNLWILKTNAKEQCFNVGGTAGPVLDSGGETILFITFSWLYLYS